MGRVDINIRIDLVRHLNCRPLLIASKTGSVLKVNMGPRDLTDAHLFLRRINGFVNFFAKFCL
jgi:hypothetical protein